MKKAKEDVADEYAREKTAHKAYKKECAALKAEYNILRLKVGGEVRRREGKKR